MIRSISDKKKANNEAVFRVQNERIKKNFDEIKKMAYAHGQPELKPDYNIPVAFLCECSDENCLERVKINLMEYTKIHKNRKFFTMIKNHNAKEIERVVEDRKDFIIVEKFKKPSESPESLTETDVNNTNPD